MKGNQSKPNAAEHSQPSDAAIIAGYYEQQNAQYARVIHDGPAQKLTAAMIELSLWKSDIEEGNAPSAAAIQALSEVLQSVSSDVREVTSRMRPRALDLFGVGAVIESMASKRGHCRFRQTSKSISMDAEIAIQLIRIAKALLAPLDVATELELELAQTDAGVTLCLSGSARFEISPLAAARARAFGGCIERQPRSLTVRLPGTLPENR